MPRLAPALGLVGLVTLFLAGCGDSAASGPTPTPDAHPEAAKSGSGKADRFVESPKNLEPTKIAIYRTNGAAQVGITFTEALEIFPEPARVFESTELPAGFRSPYRARIWENDREGFGAILYNDRIAAMLWTRTGVTNNELQDVLRLQEASLRRQGEFLSSGSTVSYWFWREDDQTLMVSASVRKDGKVDVTVAVGSDEVMTALRATPSAASRDIERLNLMRLRKPVTPAASGG